MQKRVRKEKTDYSLKEFFLGIIIFLVVQAIFMLGGLFFENFNGDLISGIPSAIGLTLVLFIGLYFNSKNKENIFFGNFVLAFLAPLILFAILIFAPAKMDIPLIYYTLGYMSLLVIIVYLSFFFKILTENK